VSTTISLILVGTKETLPDGLSHILDAEPDFSIIGKADDFSHGISLVKQHTPTIVVLWLPILDESAITILSDLKAVSPRTRTIIIAPNFIEEHVTSVFNAGCAGFVLKERYAAEIVRAVLAVTVGRHYLGYPLFERAIEAYLAYGYATFPNFPDLALSFPE
jgi:DNA-binding NarL/FixJ family response regulator